jgi:CHRD domain-containing protein
MAMKAKRRGFAALWMGAAILWIAQSVGGQSGETFKARLSPVPIDMSMMAAIAGSGSVTAVLVGRKLTISGTFVGLRSPATVARIHRGPKGIRGPAIFDLAVSQATSGTISGSLDLTPTQVEDLRNSRFYVQIYSERAPDGNLWGWLLR